MVRVLYKTLFAMLAAMALSPTDATLDVAYSPFQPNKDVTREVLVAELSLLAVNFSAFRTYHTVINGINLIEIAAEVGLQIDVGVHMTDEQGINAEIEAVCVAYKSYAETIRTVYLGNENLQNNGFGKFSVVEIVKYIQQVQACVGVEVRVGTAQRINEWLTAPGIEAIVQVSTANGVNIHPFFANMGSMSPADMLKAQWGQLVTKYTNVEFFTVAETGWPSGGDSINGNIASIEIAQQYLLDVTLWSADKTVIWFMFSDSLVSYNGLEIEKHFGLYDATCTTAKLELPLKQILPNLGNTSSPSPPGSSMPAQHDVPTTMLGDPLVRTPETSGTPTTSTNNPLEQGPTSTSTPSKSVDAYNEPSKPAGTSTGKDCPS